MLTIYAKNMAGTILTLSLSYGVTADALRQAICPDDPSCVTLLARRSASKEHKGEMSDDTLHDMMDELHEMGIRDGREEEEEEEYGMETCVWEDGDTVEYWLEVEELMVQLTPSLGGPYYAISDKAREQPLYPIHIWLDKKVEKRIATEEKGEKEEEEEEEEEEGLSVRTVYTWSFLFSLYEGKYRCPSDYAMEVEGGGWDVYLALRPAGKWYGSVFDAIHADSSIPARYKERMLRAVYRKWSKLLRNMAKKSAEERRLQTVHATEYTVGEKAIFKQHYYALRASRHNVPHN